MIRSDTTARVRTVAVAALLVLSVVALPFAGTAAAQAEVSVTNYELSTASANVSETVNVTATVANTGNETGTETVNLTVDGAVVANETVSVADNGSENVTLSTSFDAPGTYAVVVNDLNATNVTVSADSTGEADGNASVFLSPDEELLRTGGVGQFDVVLNGTDGGVGSLNVTVTTENATRLELTRAASNVSDDANVSISVDENGTNVTVAVENGTTADTGNVTLAVVEVRARSSTVSGPPSFLPGPPDDAGPPGSDDGDDDESAPGADLDAYNGSALVNLSVAVNGLTDENGTDYAVNATGNASVVVEPGPPAEPPGLEKARDLDGDGTYDDLDGDGRTTVIDAATMLDTQNTIDRMPENARLGFDKNGDGEFSIVDVAAFLREV